MKRKIINRREDAWFQVLHRTQERLDPEVRGDILSSDGKGKGERHRNVTLLKINIKLVLEGESEVRV